VKLRIISQEIINYFSPKCCNLFVDERGLCHLGSGTPPVAHHPVETHYDSVVVQPDMIMIVQVAKKYPKSSWVWNPRSLSGDEQFQALCVFLWPHLIFWVSSQAPKISSTNILSPKRKILCKYKCMWKKTEISKPTCKRTWKSPEP
jgi:hypothetical protein